LQPGYQADDGSAGGRTTGYRGTSIDYRDMYESLGLGYDVHIKKHKVVRIYYCAQPMSSSSGCAVFEINGPTKMWRPTGEKPTGWIDKGNISVFVQEHVYPGSLSSSQKDIPQVLLA
jgi:hypothetical protein